MSRWFSQFYYSFPVQLLILQLRNNFILLLIWLFLTFLLTGSIGSKYGIKLLFWAPEYLGEVGFWSFFFIGFTYGSLVMTWNLTSYLLGAHYFPFLATLKRPFTKFALNNMVIPVAFAVAMLYRNVKFTYAETESLSSVGIHMLGFLGGVSALVIILAVYFQFTNKDIQSYLDVRSSNPPHLAPGLRRPVDFYGIRTGMDRWRVDTYLTESFRPRLVRSVAHYDPTILLRVFRQNHLNAVKVELASVVILLILGYLIDYPSFRIPAGASIFLMASVAIALTGAVSYWFHRWRITVFMVLLIGLNYLTRFDGFNHRSRAYGLDYSERAEYTYQDLRNIFSPANVRADSLETIQILENWRRKASVTENGKPKMVFLCVSGGGLKSTLWTMRVMQKADEQQGGHFLDNVVLISGASGGMIGAAYYRELYWQKVRGENLDLSESCYPEMVTKDLLNSIAFTIVTNDLFIPWARFDQGGYTYVKDRGYVFEQQLNDNVDDAFRQTLADYQQPEADANIPLMFFTPAVVNDGRRMIISPQKVSYMMGTPASLNQKGDIEIDAVDFCRLFEKQNGTNLGFAAALRMNATFPYILPNVYLPTNPAVEVMDAGFRDNFGLKSATRFIHVFKNWINENTAGVVLVQVRAFDRKLDIPASDNQGMMESVFNPLGIAGQVISLQNYEHDASLGFLYDILGKDKFEVVHFTYEPGEGKEAAPISFHLTNGEREDISAAVDLEENKDAFSRLFELLNPVSRDLLSDK
ncbi:MAG: patatin-like phospholipase family protein [Saprospiraceae bacterium]|nr:patatin-like phospholipase family protein [Saprospiraceae bacterium]